MVVGHLLLTAAFLKKDKDRGFERVDEEQRRKDREIMQHELPTAPRRVAHNAEEGYKQRYLPDQGWIDVTPSRTFQVSLRRSESHPQATNSRNDEIVTLTASMRRDDRTTEELFTVTLFPGQNAADLEKDIWRTLRIRDADVAIELLGSDGEPIPADAAVLDALNSPARIVLVSFLRRCSGDEVILSASTLGESFQVSMPGTASIDALSVKIREDMGFDASTALRLVRADGQQLHMDMLVNSIP
jgi:hypothetical protein